MTNTYLDILENYGLDVNSEVHSIRKIKEEGGLNSVDYKRRIVELTDKDCDLTDELELKFTYLYMVQNIIRISKNTEVLNIEDVYIRSYDQAVDFLLQNEWVRLSDEKLVEEGKVKTDCLGKPKRKKGVKKDMALDFYKKNVGSVEWTRKEWIQQLMDYVGLSSNGASTYYANLKSGRWS